MTHLADLLAGDDRTVLAYELAMLIVIGTMAIGGLSLLFIDYGWRRACDWWANRR